MEWITEADGVFRGGGVKGLALAGALKEAVVELQELLDLQEKIGTGPATA